MNFPAQQWQFKNHRISWLIFGAASLAVTLLVAYFVWLLPIGESWLLLAAFVALLVYILHKMSSEIYWYWHNPSEFIYLDNDDAHFCVYPFSGSLKYTDIAKAVHWYVERADNRRRYDKDIGIIITTQQGEHIYLNLERMIQGNDGISFGTNSSVVIQELNKRMKQVQAA